MCLWSEGSMVDQGLSRKWRSALFETPATGSPHVFPPSVEVLIATPRRIATGIIEVKNLAVVETCSSPRSSHRISTEEIERVGTSGIDGPNIGKGCSAVCGIGASAEGLASRFR